MVYAYTYQAVARYSVPPQAPRCRGKKTPPLTFIFWECALPTLQQQITEKFLTKLAGAKDLDEEKIEQLRALFADGKKVKPEQLVKIFSLPAGGDLK